LQRREKGSRWLSVADWWLTVVELVVEKLVMRVVVAEAAERERERGGKLQKRGQWELVFFKLWTRISLPSSHQLSLYL
jgi:hypothetical protein